MNNAKLRKALASYGSATLVVGTIAAMGVLHGPWAGIITGVGAFAALSMIGLGVADTVSDATREAIRFVHTMDRDKFKECAAVTDKLFTDTDYPGVPVDLFRYNALKIMMSGYLDAAAQGFPLREGGEVECPASTTESATP